ncbi:Mucin-associated surface protein (MASP) [Trypanosoma cruzi]|uniref:Mucin-associated surface protein (MASP), putative n=2 Tax=Trypanosoma cruzi TaxID=5693 RepID=Q4CNW1_TRYCC|nr:mucin-associated surface protein (MASP), putative [Trypanosoma cruzi]EAN81963.1 mucin-associated surface protein (MASP), putative [Trypanosoma cruzi]KAF8284678.1 Mucin-associated surface protein (MASP), subgroup S004 [Trypanosoma cruzi]KAF8303640.1 Mucin-associated surface protein (MASP), subgroup S004 [Trypanosoma cruzi]PWV13029.1 Mucin-associated surface protein (MASP) [Trypanosoma cruzi]|eukprot:XP_803490.1 mucin-associated surface protein (MASP) [Trypanosoma cruzi strain CL Brener]
MAMMMTGRVLLVCALCVLWCGAGGGGCTEGQLPDVGPPVISASGGVVPDTATSHTAPGGAGDVSAQQSQLNPVKDSASGSPPLQDALKHEPLTEQPQSDHENTDPPPHSKSLQEERRDGTPEDSPGELGALPSQENTMHASIEGPELNNPPPYSSNNNTVSSNSEERTEDTPRSTEIIDAAPSDEGHERENAAPSLEQPQETSTAAPAITTQTSSITPPDESGSNTVKMSEASPQSTGTTQTNHTATPGDSDGSTAASHSTSPLLLLLFVACAAAAAVVSA